VGSKEIKQQVEGEEEGRGLTRGSMSQGARVEASRDGGEQRRRLVAGGRRAEAKAHHWWPGSRDRGASPASGGEGGEGGSSPVAGRRQAVLWRDARAQP